VFLGHGGRLVEISPDEHSTYGSVSENRWMNVQKLSNILVNFKRAVDDRLDLIFFQNCNKGNIEVLYTFRDAAKYTLSSQLRLGAPNYYYESLLHYLGHHPQINGGKLGEKIMEFEQRDMYHSLTVTNNHYFQKLPEKINPVIDAILASDLEAVITFVNSELNSNRHHVSNRRYEFYSYYGEKFVDLVDFFQKINAISGSPVNKYKELVDFLKNSLIQKVHQNGELLSSITRPKYQNYSGIGLFLPTSRQHLEAYRYLPVYSDLRLVSLFKAILFT
jgi:hypothetical protein